MDKNITNKPCIKCGSFRRYPPRPGTKTGACIDCANARGKKWERKNPERVKEVQLNYKNNNIDTWLKSKRNSANKERTISPEKTNARREVRNAVRLKIIPAIDECLCLDCGITAKDYHHEDYQKPLEVIPLCRKCHIARHRNLKTFL